MLVAELGHRLGARHVRREQVIHAVLVDLDVRRLHLVRVRVRVRARARLRARARARVSVRMRVRVRVDLDAAERAPGTRARPSWSARRTCGRG